MPKKQPFNCFGFVADFDGRQEAAKSPSADQVEGTVYMTNNNAHDKQQNVNGDDCDLPER